MPRLLLAIESATDWLSVALLEDERVVGVASSDERARHAASLLPLLDDLLGRAGTSLERVEALAVSTGPGSFTSLRIGLATAKGLLFGRDTPAVGVSTLEAMALAGLEGDRAEPRGTAEVVALLDARRGEWYAGGFRSGDAAGALPQPGLPEGLYSPSRLAEALAPGARLCAPDPAALEALQAAGLEPQAPIVGEAARPDAVWLGRLGQRRLAAGEGLPAEALAARYVRRADAEAKRLGGPVESGERACLGSSGESG